MIQMTIATTKQMLPFAIWYRDWAEESEVVATLTILEALSAEKVGEEGRQTYG